MAKYFAIPLNDDGREMMGTHGSVTVNGKHILTHALSGEYASVENFIRHSVSKYGTRGVEYQIYLKASEWYPRRKYRRP